MSIQILSPTQKLKKEGRGYAPEWYRDDEVNNGIAVYAPMSTVNAMRSMREKARVIKFRDCIQFLYESCTDKKYTFKSKDGLRIYLIPNDYTHKKILEGDNILYIFFVQGRRLDICNINVVFAGLTDEGHFEEAIFGIEEFLDSHLWESCSAAMKYVIKRN